MTNYVFTYLLISENREFSKKFKDIPDLNTVHTKYVKAAGTWAVNLLILL